MDFSNMFCKEEDRTLERIFGVVTGLGVGLGLMYLFDPTMGRRRRSTIMDQMSSATHTAGEGIGSAWEKTTEGASGAWESVASGAKGVVDKAANMFTGDGSREAGGSQSTRQSDRRPAGMGELSDEPWSPTTRMLIGTAGGGARRLRDDAAFSARVCARRGRPRAGGTRRHQLRSGEVSRPRRLGTDRRREVDHYQRTGRPRLSVLRALRHLPSLHVAYPRSEAAR